MFSTKRVAGFAAVLATSFSIVGAAPVCGQVVSRSLLKWEQLTNQQFHRLPDGQPILHQGKQTTLGVLRAEWKTKMQQSAAKAKGGAAQAKSKFKALENKALQDLQTKQAAEGAKAKAELARLGQEEGGVPVGRAATDPAFDRIRQEAIQLYKNSKNARSAAEKARIEERAKQLLEQLRRMGKA
jgi:hypothetical protein